jgi:hypothetical protein
MGAGIQRHPRFRTSVPIGLVTPSGDVEEFTLEDISLGGLFVRTLLPAPAGSFVRMRLPLQDGELSLMGRVVHVIDDRSAQAKARARGMGVQFDGLAPDTERRLAAFVGGLVNEQRRRRDDESAPRFIDDDRVHVPADRATLARLWTAGMERGLLTVLKGAAGQRARGGLRVAVGIGPLRFTADVVVVDDTAAGLRFVDLRGAGRTAIASFIAGDITSLDFEPTLDEIPPVVVPAQVDIRPVLADARRLLAHLETDDLYGALGVDEAAPEDVLLARVRALSSSFAGARGHATPPQRARLDAAVNQLLALEGTMCGPPIVVGALIDETVRAQVEELVAEADFLASAGQPIEAQQALLEARGLAPDKSGVHRRLAQLDDSLRDNAAALLDGVEQLRREEIIARARAVNHASTSRTVLLRAMRLLASAGAHDDMLAVAQHLADLDASDELPLFAMMQVNERLERFADALRAGEALLRLRPDDYALQDRVNALAEIARRSTRERGPRL